MKRTKYAVLLIARNEEKIIIPTLESIINQTLPPTRIIVVNDGSNDGTQDKIKHRFPNEVTVLDYPDTHESYLNDPKLSRIFNYGLNELTVLDIDYLLLMGADQVLPTNYSQTLIDMMEKILFLPLLRELYRGNITRYPGDRGVCIEILS